VVKTISFLAQISDDYAIASETFADELPAKCCFYLTKHHLSALAENPTCGYLALGSSFSS